MPCNGRCDVIMLLGSEGFLLLIKRIAASRDENEQ